MKHFNVFNRLLIASAVTPIIMTAPMKAKSDGSKSVKVPATGGGDRRDGKSTKGLGSSKSVKAISESIYTSKAGTPKHSNKVASDQDQDNVLFSQSSISDAFKYYSGKASKSEKVVNQSAHNFFEASIPVSDELPSDDISGHPALSPSSFSSIEPSALPTALSTDASTTASTVASTIMSTVESTTVSTAESTERPTLGLFLFGAKTSKFRKQIGDEYQ